MYKQAKFQIKLDGKLYTFTCKETNGKRHDHKIFSNGQSSSIKPEVYNNYLKKLRAQQ